MHESAHVALIFVRIRELPSAHNEEGKLAHVKLELSKPVPVRVSLSVVHNKNIHDLDIVDQVKDQVLVLKLI